MLRWPPNRVRRSAPPHDREGTARRYANPGPEAERRRGKLRAPSAKRRSRGRTSHAVTRGLQSAALARRELRAVLVRVTPNLASVEVSRGVRETSVVSDELVRAVFVAGGRLLSAAATA